MDRDGVKSSKPDFVINVDILHTQIGVFKTINGLRKWMNDHGCSDTAEEFNKHNTSGYSAMIYDPKKVPYFLMAISPAASIGVVVHEAVHISWYIFAELGIEISKDNHEIMSYLVEYITCEVAKKLRIGV